MNRDDFVLAGGRTLTFQFSHEGPPHTSDRSPVFSYLLFGSFGREVNGKFQYLSKFRALIRSNLLSVEGMSEGCINAASGLNRWKHQSSF
jgi:hypothetical protein